MQASFPPARVNLRDGKKKAKRRPKVPTGEASTAPRGDAKPEAWKERDLDAWHDVEHQRSRRPREAHADSENDTEEDEDALGEDYESGNRSHASSRASSRSNFSTKSYPRAAPPSRRREHDRRGAGAGYQSEDPTRWSSLGPNTSQRALRSSLRRDMRQILSRALRQRGENGVMLPSYPYELDEMSSGGSAGGARHHQSIGYQTIPQVLPVQAQPGGPAGPGGAASLLPPGVLPFACGCVVSCLGLSYVGLIVYAVYAADLERPRAGPVPQGPRRGGRARVHRTRPERAGRAARRRRTPGLGTVVPWRIASSPRPRLFRWGCAGARAR